MKKLFYFIPFTLSTLSWSQDDTSSSLGLQLSVNNITIGENVQSGINTSESVGVYLTVAPQNNTTVKLTYNDTSEFTVIPNSIVFTPSNYNTEQKFTFTAINDGIVDGSQTISVDVIASSFTHDSGNGDGGHDSGNGDGGHDSGNGDGAHDSGNGDGGHDSGNGDGGHDSGNGDGGHDSGNGDGGHDSGNGDGAHDSGNGDGAHDSGNGDGGHDSGNGDGGHDSGSNNGTTDIEETLTLSVTVLDFKNTLSVSEISLNQITAYPNPVQGDYINFSGLTNEYIATVYDLSGKIYSVTKISPKNSKVEVSDIPTSLYILKIHDENNSRVFSIVIE